MPWKGLEWTTAASMRVPGRSFCKKRAPPPMNARLEKQQPTPTPTICPEGSSGGIQGTPDSCHQQWSSWWVPHPTSTEHPMCQDRARLPPYILICHVMRDPETSRPRQQGQWASKAIKMPKDPKTSRIPSHLLGEWQRGGVSEAVKV